MLKIIGDKEMNTKTKELLEYAIKTQKETLKLLEDIDLTYDKESVRESNAKVARNDYKEGDLDKKALKEIRKYHKVENIEYLREWIEISFFEDYLQGKISLDEVQKNFIDFKTENLKMMGIVKKGQEPAFTRYNEMKRHIEMAKKGGEEFEEFYVKMQVEQLEKFVESFKNNIVSLKEIISESTLSNPNNQKTQINPNDSSAMDELRKEYQESQKQEESKQEHKHQNVRRQK